MYHKTIYNLGRFTRISCLRKGIIGFLVFNLVLGSLPTSLLASSIDGGASSIGEEGESTIPPTGDSTGEEGGSIALNQFSPASETIITPPPPVVIPVIPAPVIPAPVVPAPIVPAPVVPAPVVPAPIVPAPVVPAPIVPAPIAVSGGGGSTGLGGGGGGGGSGVVGETTVVVSSGGGGNSGGGGGGGSYAMRISNPTIRQICDTISVQWTTNQLAQSRILMGTTSVSIIPLSAPLLGYSFEFGTSTVGTTHLFTVPVVSGITYYFRPVSTISGYTPVIGSELSFTVVESIPCSSNTGVSISTTVCPYITDYLQRGRKNNQEQVFRLQLFLKYKEGINLPISGIFDEATERGVHAFQNKYRTEVLDPWSFGTVSSGYVYILTKGKINQLMCGGALPVVATVRSNISVPTPQENLVSELHSIQINSTQNRAISTPESPVIAELVTTVVATSTCASQCLVCERETLLSNLLLLLIVILLLLLLIQKHSSSHKEFQAPTLST